MAVHTRLETGEIEAYLERYDVGALRHAQGIEDGIDNTNYFVTTTAGSYVLTLYEGVERGEPAYFLALMACLSELGIPCAHPVPDRRGQYLLDLRGRPAALVERLPGASVLDPGASHCEQAGRLLARMHRAGGRCGAPRVNPRGPAWRREAARRLRGRLSAPDAELLAEELEFQARVPLASLPHGVVHADLFRDNVLFEDGALSGVIDFYYACADAWLLDLAIAANDWCADAEAGYSSARLQALLDGYGSGRELSAVEREQWPALARLAALRFWLSRLVDLHFPRATEGRYVKDPDEYRRVLERRIADHAAGAGPFD